MEVGDSVLRGARRVVLISGEAGVGKSRTVAELTNLLRTRNCRVMVGRCVEHGDHIWPLAALRELLSTLVDELDDDLLQFVLGPSATLLAPLIPELAEPSTVGVSSVDPDRLCEAVVGVLRRMSQWGPTAVVVEDLHWADESTRALFALLARSSRPQSFLLVGTHRELEPSVSSPLHPILDDVMRSSRPDSIALRPFDRATTLELVSSLAPGVFDDDAVDEIHRLSGGNAFYIEELTAARVRSDSSESLRNVVLARVGDLSVASRDVLDVVSICGRTPPTVLASALRVEQSELTDAVTTLFDLGLLVRDAQEIRFRHELARSIVAGELGPARAAELHRRVAGALESVRADRAGEIAVHWAAGGDDRRALTAFVVAARDALRDGMAVEALSNFRRALALWDQVANAGRATGTDKVLVTLMAADAAYQARRLAEARELIGEALTEAGTDRWRQGEAWLVLAILARFERTWAECVNSLERALTLIPTTPPSKLRIRALDHGALMHASLCQFDEARACVAEAEHASSLLGDREAIVMARHARAAIDGMFSDDDESLIRFGLETAELCDDSVSPEYRLFAYDILARALSRAGRYSELVDAAAAAVGLMRSSGLGGPMGPALAHHWVGALFALGRWDEAAAVYDEVGEFVDGDGNRPGFLEVIRMQLCRGRINAVRGELERIRAIVHDPEFWGMGFGPAAALVADFDAADGRGQAIAGLVDMVFARCLTPYPIGEWLLLKSAFCAEPRHPADRGALVDRSEAWVCHAEHRAGLISRPDRVHRAAALAGLAELRGESSRALWSGVADEYAGLGCRYDEAAARFRAAQATLAGPLGRSVASHRAVVDDLRRAHHIAVQLDAVPLMRRIELLATSARLPLDRADAEPAAVSPLAVLGLTTREANVLQLVAAGLSNGAIGERLYISRKTASVHVSNILRKLGVSNRIEAAGILHRISLDADGAASANGFDP